MGDGNDKNDTRGPSGTGGPPRRPPPPPPRSNRGTLGKGAPPPPPRRGIGNENFRARQAAILGGMSQDAAQKYRAKVKKTQQEKDAAHQPKPVILGRDIRKMSKKEVPSPHKPAFQGADLKKRGKYLGKIAKHGLTIIAHTVATKKARKPQVEAIEELMKLGAEGKLTADQMYGGLLYIQDQIGKTKFDSRLNRAISEICADLQKDNPGLKQKEVAEAAVKQFELRIGTDQSVAQQNPIFQEIRARFEMQQNAAEAMQRGPFMTEDRKNKAMRVLKKTVGQTRAYKTFGKGGGGSFLAEVAYGSNRSLKSKIFQKKARVGQLARLQKTMIRLSQAEGTDNQKAEVMIGLLMDLREQVMAEKPKDPDYLKKSSLGKMVSKMLENIGVDPDKITDDQKAQVEQMKENCRSFEEGGKLIEEARPNSPRNR